MFGGNFLFFSEEKLQRGKYYTAKRHINTMQFRVGTKNNVGYSVYKQKKKIRT